MKRNVFTALIAALFIIGFIGQASAADLPAAFIAKHGEQIAYVVTSDAYKLVKGEFAKLQAPSTAWNIGEKVMGLSKNGNFYRHITTGSPDKRWNVQTADNKWMPYDLNGLKKQGKNASVNIPDDLIIPNEPKTGFDFAGKVVEFNAQEWASIQ